MPALRPEILPVICAFLTLFVLSLTNRPEVRQCLQFRLSTSVFGLFVVVLPGRTVLFVLCTIAGCSGGLSLLPLPIGFVLGLAAVGGAIGFVLNLPFLAYTVHRAWEAVRLLRAEAEAAIEAGRDRAYEELDGGQRDKRIWGSCFKDAEEDSEIAGTFYVRRRSRALAQTKLLEGGKWAPWIPITSISVICRELFAHMDEDNARGQMRAAPPN